ATIRTRYTPTTARSTVEASAIRFSRMKKIKAKTLLPCLPLVYYGTGTFHSTAITASYADISVNLTRGAEIV
ncbi:MAG: hypothetical protein V1794_07330, partial [Candidatus Glassbacteria bacterium]